MWLESLTLENFKSHKTRPFEFSRFTIFIGPNSAGKSSVLQALLILKNTLSKKPYSGIATRTEAYDLGSYSDLATLGNTDEPIRIGINGRKMVPSLVEGYETKASFGYSLSFNRNGPVEVYLGITVDAYKISFSWDPKNGSRCNFIGQGSREIPIIPEIDGIHPRMQISANLPVTRNFNQLFQNGDFTNEILRDFYYVPFYRTLTKYGARLARVQDDILESRPEDLTSANLSKLSKDTKLLDKVSGFMTQLIGKTVRPRNLDLPVSSDQGVTLDFVGKSFSNAIINEGTGPNQAIFLLSIILGTPKNSVIAIDEPEIHLHPNFQSKLAKIMMHIAKNDSKQLIFATHSEHMIYPFLASIANKSLTPNDVTIYYFDIDENSNLSRVEKLEINEHGQLRGGLKGFWDSDLVTLSDFLGESHE